MNNRTGEVAFRERHGIPLLVCAKNQLRYYVSVPCLALISGPLCPLFLPTLSYSAIPYRHSRDTYHIHELSQFKSMDVLTPELP
jgi:hypothetical protein